MACSPHSVSMKGWFQDLLRIQTSDAQIPSIKWHRTFPVVQWWRLQVPSTGDWGSISGRGTKIPHAKLHGQNKTKRESVKKKKWHSKTGRLYLRFLHLGRWRADCGSNVTCWHLAEVSLSLMSSDPGTLLAQDTWSLLLKGLSTNQLCSLFSVLCFLQSGG